MSHDIQIGHSSLLRLRLITLVRPTICWAATPFETNDVRLAGVVGSSKMLLCRAGSLSTDYNRGNTVRAT